MKGAIPVTFNFMYDDDANTTSDILGENAMKLSGTLGKKIKDVPSEKVTSSIRMLIEQGELSDKELTLLVLSGSKVMLMGM